MKNTLNIIQLLCLTALCVPTLSFAQTAEPQNFFKNEYVKGTLDGERSVQSPRNTQRRIDGARWGNKETTTGNTQPAKDGEFAGPTFYQDGIDENALYDDGKRIAVKRVSYIGNARTEAEGYEDLARFSNFLIEYNLTAQKAHLLHSPTIGTQDAPNDWVRIMARGGTIKHGRSIADIYNIQRVPAWLFHTEKGDILLEGYEDVSKFMTSKGELKTSIIGREVKVERETVEEDSSDAK